MKIHPLIEKIKISKKAKLYLNEVGFYEVIEDKILLSTPNHEIDECRENLWSLYIDLEYCDANDILGFYHSVIDSRRQYIKDNNIQIKMIFYTWHDAVSGMLYFSIIPQNWSKLAPGNELPFGCTVNKVDKLEVIIKNFIDDPYKGSIPIDEFEKVDPSDDDDDEDEDIKNYVLDVWSTLL